MSGTFRYGDPASNQTLIGPKPKCWGLKYDNEDRECKGCGFQHTCRDTVLKAKSAQLIPGTPVTSYYSQFPTNQTYSSPQAIVPSQPVKTEIVPVKPAVPQAIPQKLTPGVVDRYGQFNDPMFLTLKGTPSIMRPQLNGETFAKRIAKNVLLASAESALGEVLLGVRQLIWAPLNEDEEEKK